MADDRYDWLDGEAAERLLRGFPLNARSAAAETPDGADERLAAALDALAAEHAPAFPPGTCSQRCELPGEAEALRAFQAAHSPLLEGATVGAEKAAGAPSASTAKAASGGRTRLRGRRGQGWDGTGGAVPRGSRSILFGKPLRAGFAMAVAGCALGGVAVAASEGVLPTPFGGGGTPAVSVSPVISPDEQGAKGGSGEGSATPGDEDDAREGSADAGDRSDSPQDDLAGSGDRKKTDEGVTASRGSESPSGSGGEKGDKEEDEDGKPPPDPDKEAVAAALCQSYEQDELDPEKRKKLEQAAGGREAVEQFCEEHGEGGGQGSGSGGSEGSDGGGSSGGGSGGGGPGRPGDGSGAGGGGHAPSTGGGDSGGGGGSNGNGGPAAPSSGGQGDAGMSQAAGVPSGLGSAADGNAVVVKVS